MAGPPIIITVQKTYHNGQGFSDTSPVCIGLKYDNDIFKQNKKTHKKYNQNEMQNMIQSALHINGFLIHGFNQLQKKKKKKI